MKAMNTLNKMKTYTSEMSIFWLRLASFGHLELTSNPHYINFQAIWNGLNDRKETNINHPLSSKLTTP